MSMPLLPLMIMNGVLARSRPEIFRPVWCGTQVLAVADRVLELDVLLVPSMCMPLMALLADSVAAPAGEPALSASAAPRAAMPRTADAGLRRRTSPAGELQASLEAMTVGTMAAASRMISGPAFGS